LLAYVFLGDHLTVQQIIGLAIGFIGSLPLLQYTSLVSKSPLSCLCIFVGTLLGRVVFGGSRTVKQIVGMCMGFLCAASIAMYLTQDDPSVIHTLLSWPDVLLLCAVFTGAYGWIVVKKARVLGYNLACINGIAMTGGGVIMLIHSLIQEGIPHLYTQPIGFTQHGSLLVAIAAVLYLLVVSNIICYSLYTWLLDYYSVTLLSFLGLTTPIFTACFSVLLLHEQVTWHFVLTFVLIAVGLALFYADERVLKKEKPPVDLPNREPSC
jgi:drug/metabolite transporter (DMT)-like permease